VNFKTYCEISLFPHHQQILKKIFAILHFYIAIKMLGWDALFIKWIKDFLHEENDHFVALANK